MISILRHLDMLRNVDSSILNNSSQLRRGCKISLQMVVFTRTNGLGPVGNFLGFMLMRGSYSVSARETTYFGLDTNELLAEPNPGRLGGPSYDNTRAGHSNKGQAPSTSVDTSDQMYYFSSQTVNLDSVISAWSPLTYDTS